MQLHEKLNAIAQGQIFSESALYEALHHAVTAGNDKQVIMRYALGINTSADRFSLQDLAVRINEYEGNKNAIVL